MYVHGTTPFQDGSLGIRTITPQVFYRWAQSDANTIDGHPGSATVQPTVRGYGVLCWHDNMQFAE